MDGSFQTVEKAAKLHNRSHHRKSSEKDHNSFFNLPSQPAGNLATQRLLRSGVIRPKLAVSQRGDVHEQEADRVADQVMRMPTSPSAVTGQASVQRQTLEEEEVAPMGTAGATITPRSQHAPEEEDELQTMALLQRMPSDPLRSFEPGADFQARLSTSSGSPLPASTRAFMEPRFGADFSGVRLHTGGEAMQLTRAVSAQAFTHGQDIYLGEGTNNLESSAGKQLLAHELVHVVQQSHGGPAPSLALSAPHERDSHAAALAVPTGLQSVKISSHTGVGLARIGDDEHLSDPETSTTVSSVQGGTPFYIDPDVFDFLPDPTTSNWQTTSCVCIVFGYGSPFLPRMKLEVGVIVGAPLELRDGHKLSVREAQLDSANAAQAAAEIIKIMLDSHTIGPSEVQPRFVGFMGGAIMSTGLGYRVRGCYPKCPKT